MHYANCATFNADFDGDEINLHLPQVRQALHIPNTSGSRHTVTILLPTHLWGGMHQANKRWPCSLQRHVRQLTMVIACDLSLRRTRTCDVHTGPPRSRGRDSASDLLLGRTRTCPFVTGPPRPGGGLRDRARGRAVHRAHRRQAHPRPHPGAAEGCAHFLGVRACQSWRTWV